MSVNALTVDGKYCLVNRDSLTQPIQEELSKNQQAFCEFFLRVWNVNQILNIFAEKMTLMAYVF